MASHSEEIDAEPGPPLVVEHVSLLGKAAIGLVRVYQFLFRPIMGNVCRFYPSCSDYMILAIRKHGLIRGIFKGLWRICKCQPFHPGGVDYP